MEMLASAGTGLCAAALICLILLVLAPDSASLGLFKIGLTAFLLSTLILPFLHRGVSLSDPVSISVPADIQYSNLLHSTVRHQIESALRKKLTELMGTEDAEISFIYNTADKSGISIEEIRIALPASAAEKKQKIIASLSEDSDGRIVFVDEEDAWKR